MRYKESKVHLVTILGFATVGRCGGLPTARRGAGLRLAVRCRKYGCSVAHYGVFGEEKTWMRGESRFVNVNIPESHIHAHHGGRVGGPRDRSRGSFSPSALRVVLVWLCSREVTTD